LLLNRKEPYRKYLMRRAFRLFPAYLLCLTFAFVVQPAIYDMHTADWVSQRNEWRPFYEVVAYNPWPYFLTHLAMLHGVMPTTVLPFGSGAILGVAWSLSLEWQFYLLAPFLIALMRRTWWALVLVILALYGIRHLLVVSEPLALWDNAFFFMSSHFFIVGILSRIALEKWRSQPWFLAPGIILVALLAMPLYKWEISVWGFFWIGMYFERSDRALNYVSRFYLTIYRGISSSKPLIALGRASFSTYLVHIPFFAVMIWLGKNVLNQGGQIGAINALAVGLILLVPLSLVMHKRIELPFMALGSRLIGR